MNECPYCFEPVKPTAKKCPHCQEWLDIHSSERDQHVDQSDELHRIKMANEVRDAVEKELKRKYSIFGILLTVFLGFVISGGALLFVSPALMKSKIHLEDANEDIKKFREKVGSIVDDLETKLQKTAKRTETVKKNLETESKKLVWARQNLDDIDKEFQALGNRVSKLEAVSQEALSPAQRDAIQIKQVPEEFDSKSTNITFSIYVDPNEQSHQATEILKRLERVIYYLDEKWFRESALVRLNRFDKFKMTIRVWGSTKVRVEIYEKNIVEPIVREGFMNLHETSFFKAS